MKQPLHRVLILAICLALVVGCGGSRGRAELPDKIGPLPNKKPTSVTGGQPPKS